MRAWLAYRAKRDWGFTLATLLTLKLTLLKIVGVNIAWWVVAAPLGLTSGLTLLLVAVVWAITTYEVFVRAELPKAQRYEEQLRLSYRKQTTHRRWRSLWS